MPAVKAKARQQLEEATDRLARGLLNMTSDPNVADPVKLAAIKDALDRGGVSAKTAVSVEVGMTKPWESVFDGISKVMARPRDDPNVATPGEVAIVVPRQVTGRKSFVVGRHLVVRVDNPLPVRFGRAAPKLSPYG